MAPAIADNYDVTGEGRHRLTTNLWTGQIEIERVSFNVCFDYSFKLFHYRFVFHLASQTCVEKVASISEQGTVAWAEIGPAQAYTM